MVVTSKNMLVTPKKEPAFKLEHSLKQKYPKKRDHYSFDDFFHFQSDTGLLLQRAKSMLTQLTRLSVAADGRYAIAEELQIWELNRIIVG